MTAKQFLRDQECLDNHPNRSRAAGAARPCASSIRVCFTGRNRAGSWKIRGAQIAGRRRNWHAGHDIDETDLDRFDVFCFVKRPIPELMERLHRKGKIVVFDVVDSWAQPNDGLACADLSAVRSLFARKWGGLPPISSFIFANRTMQRHLGGLTRHNTFIYHHYHPEILPNPMRRTVQTIGYQGNVGYLGQWAGIIEDICRRRGLEFVVCPEFDSGFFGSIDIGFAARGGNSDVFMANHYKSNVKLANLYGSGTPCIVSAKDASYHETDNGDVRFFSNERQLEQQVNALLDHDLRRAIGNSFRVAARAFHIDRIADTYEYYFITLARLHDAGRLS